MRWLSLLLPTLTSAGCAGNPSSVAALRSVAAVDLRCPESKLVTERIDDRSRWVVGCGERLLYLYECGDDRKCGWKMSDARH